VGLLQRVLRQRILLAGQWNLLRLEEQALLPGLLGPIAQLLQWVPGQCILLASQWDMLRMEEQGLLRNMPVLSSSGTVGRLNIRLVRLGLVSCIAIFLARLGLVVPSEVGSRRCSPVSGTCYAWKNKASFEEASFEQLCEGLEIAFSASAIEKCTAVTTTGITWSALLSRSHPGGAEGE